MKILAFVSAVAFVTFSSSSFAASVDLSTWSSPEGTGNWTVAGDKNSVYQSTNTTEPTVFFNGIDSLGLALSGEITVENAAGDDDFIGFVLGYNALDLGSASADYLLLDWKRADQTAFSAFADVGLAISRVTGAMDTTEAWGHSGDVIELARGNTLFSTGWVQGQTYTFDLIFTTGLIQVYVDEVLELSVEGSFANGSFGFYNFSQAGVRYAGLQQEDAPPNLEVVPLPASALLLLSSLGSALLIRRRRAS